MEIQHQILQQHFSRLKQRFLEVKQDFHVTKKTLIQNNNFFFVDRKIVCLGLIQALFEGSMYVFVVNWTPAIAHLDTYIPYGLVFSSFMVRTIVYLFGLKNCMSGIVINERNVIIERNGENIGLGDFRIFWTNGFSHCEAVSRVTTIMPIPLH